MTCIIPECAAAVATAAATTTEYYTTLHATEHSIRSGGGVLLMYVVCGIRVTGSPITGPAIAGIVCGLVGPRENTT